MTFAYFLNNIDNYAKSSAKWTTSMFSYFKSKIVSFHIPTPAPFSKVNKWFFTWRNQALLFEENKIIAYHQARIECYGYHGYGNEHLNERSMEMNLFILREYKRKVEELESFKKELEQKNLISRSSEEKDNILVQYTELILSYQNYKIPALKKVIEENNNGIEHNVIQIRKDNIDEVVGNKISEIKKQYEQLIIDLKTQHDNDKLEIRRQYHVADEGHVNEIRTLQQHNHVLEQTNAQLQKLIDDHSILNNYYIYIRTLFKLMIISLTTCL